MKIASVFVLLCTRTCSQRATFAAEATSAGRPPEVLPDGHVTSASGRQKQRSHVRGEWVADGGIRCFPSGRHGQGYGGVWSVTVGPLPREVLSYYFTIDGVGVVDP